MKITVLYIAIFVLGTTALAHENVHNPVIKARMSLMNKIKISTRELASMARGTIPFDPDLAESAKEDLLNASEEIVSKFQKEEVGEGSEASQNIWIDWEDFVNKSTDFSNSVADLNISTLEDLRGSFSEIGAGCKNCHKIYRVK
tara:strand:- start:45 stop:476 length:432 start_codon:yes stop_codon:yes gene_type:complete